ncbi:glycosyltransferase family 4 protein [Cetobacterium sp.]|uniref:glycosyltransferase family 4 protein n=1 Tax=Cetobacterium sp. TaxID=2071632 RepID=UPI003EE71559
MKKIVFVETVGHGLYNFRGGVIKKLCDDGYKVYIVSPPFEKSKEMEKWGCKYISISIDRLGTNPIKDLKIILNLKKIYSKIKPDLIFHYSIKPNIYGGIAARLLSLKYIAVIPGAGRVFHIKNLKYKVIKILYQIGLKKAIKVFFLNNDDLNEFLREKIVNKNQTLNIKSEGVNVEIFSSKKENIKFSENIKFLMISRINKEKGIFEYFKAAEIIKKKYKKVNFFLLGGKGEIKESDFEELLSLKNVTYLGVTDKVDKVIDSVDCIVLPSYREGTPRTLLEAGAMGKPIISTNCIGSKDVVDDGINGFLCEVKNSTDLAKKIEKFIELPSKEKEKMGENSSKKINKEFNEKRIIEEYYQVINSI